MSEREDAIRARLEAMDDIHLLAPVACAPYVHPGVWAMDVRYLLGEIARLNEALREMGELKKGWYDAFCVRVRERGEALAENARLHEERRAVQEEERVLTCVFCGHIYEPGTPASNHVALTEHVAVCPSHPAAAFRLRAERAEHDLKRERFEHESCEHESAYQRQRAEHAEAAIARVDALCERQDELGVECRGLVATSEIRDALNAREQT
jgi:hypothetical protein